MAKKNQRTFFMCSGQALATDGLTDHQSRHIIGELVTVFENETRVTALALYEKSQGAATPPETLPTVRAVIIGNARDLTCTCCGTRASWFIGKAAIKNVVKRYQAE